MKNACKNICTVALISLKKTSLYSVIDDFTSKIDINNVDSLEINQFYTYISQKYSIKCEMGMLFIEKMVVYNLFHKFKLNKNSSNRLLNEKILLYQWIKPEHLKLPKDIDLQQNIADFHKIHRSNVPSVKIFYLMKAVKHLYKKIGETTSYDTILSCIIYCLIRSKIKDLFVHISFMRMFRRDYFNDCNAKCDHGFSININCDCLISYNWKNEEKYYLTTCEAAIEWIQKVEYYNLSIEINEFEKEITDKMKNLNFTKKNESLSPHFEHKYVTE
ncbi:hypothetical protein NUSPORA_01544 [Nucleospora cyclopteri]